MSHYKAIAAFLAQEYGLFLDMLGIGTGLFFHLHQIHDGAMILEAFTHKDI
jgi:hypothetical protein